jgi:hypothetical protein
MRISSLEYIIFFIFAIGCGRTNHEDENLATELSPVAYGESTYSINFGGNVDYMGLYPTFEYTDKDRHIWQGLGLKKLTIDSIKFVLVVRSDSCESHFVGYAISNRINVPKNDENQNEPFASTEYFTEGIQYTMRIRLSLERDKAKVYYQEKQGEKIDCLSPMNKMLRMNTTLIK